MRGVAGSGILSWRTVCRVMVVLVGAGPVLSGFAVTTAEGEREAVVAGHKAAVEAGMEILARGGTAMDAAVTVSLYLGLAEPYGSGLGGKLAMVYWDAEAGEATYIEALDEAGSRFVVAAYEALPRADRQAGGGAVAVPGLLRGLESGHRLFGRLRWEDCVVPVVRAAREGVEVTAGMERFFAGRMERIEVTVAAERLFAPEGRPVVAGDQLRNHDLARTLEAVAEGGADAFYTGVMAERLARGIREAGGHLTAEDFAAYAAEVTQPLQVNWLGKDVVAAGPPVHGAVQFLLALRLLETFDWTGVESLRGAVGMDRVGRVFRTVYPRVQGAIADTPDGARRAAELLSDSLLARLAEEAQAAAGRVGAEDPDHGSTTHFVVWDRSGNVACVTQSLSHHFGSGVVVPGTGVLFNNSLTNFSLGDPLAVNAAEARKRPRSTICPALVLEGGVPVAAVGLPGGGRIPTAMVSVFLDRWIFGRPMEEAISARRFHPVRDPSPEPVSNTIAVEGSWPAETLSELEDLGWHIEPVEEAEYFGGFCVVERLPDGRLRAYADSRRSNYAQAR